MIDNKKEFKEIRRTIGQNMYNLRKRKRMTLKKLSQLSSIGVNMLDQYELGKNQIALHSLRNIAKALEVSMHDLLIEQHPIIQAGTYSRLP